MLEVKEISCKSALVQSKLPDADYVVNPYTGCELACSYCYASFMSKFIDKPFYLGEVLFTLKLIL